MGTCPEGIWNLNLEFGMKVEVRDKYVKLILTRHLLKPSGHPLIDRKKKKTKQRKRFIVFCIF